MSFELYTKRLDIVDEVHEILLQDLGGSDVSYFNLLSEELPTFAVTGAESSGKSTLANKISGTRLPVKEFHELRRRYPTSWCKVRMTLYSIQLFLIHGLQSIANNRNKVISTHINSTQTSENRF